MNLDKAPRNARGLVEFSTTFYILKPVEMSRGNGKIFYGDVTPVSSSVNRLRADPSAFGSGVGSSAPATPGG